MAQMPLKMVALAVLAEALDMSMVKLGVLQLLGKVLRVVAVL
jgi:hypothetical protein